MQNITLIQGFGIQMKKIKNLFRVKEHSKKSEVAEEYQKAAK